jgi:hypothetical protein
MSSKKQSEFILCDSNRRINSKLADRLFLTLEVHGVAATLRTPPGSVLATSSLGLPF